VDDETEFEELTLLSLSSETVKNHSIAYDFIEHEVKFNLKGRRVTDDTRETIVKEIESILESEGANIDYY
jgi:hypothetical protein